MKANVCTLACAGALLMCASAAAAKSPAKKSAPEKVSSAALIAAAKSAMLSEINYGRELCDADRSVEVWLTDVVGDTAASITWRGGSCKLVSDLNPLDAGSRWCAGATIVPKGHPKEPAEIEIFFEKPVGGKPGKPYAFRSVDYDDDGPEYGRFLIEFDRAYRQRYVEGFEPPETSDCD
jgi:hypothetical protein